MNEVSGPLDEIRSILRSGRPDAEIVAAVRRAVGPDPAPTPSLQPEQRQVVRDNRNWPILAGGTAWDRHDDPEMT